MEHHQARIRTGTGRQIRKQKQHSRLARLIIFGMYLYAPFMYDPIAVYKTVL
jgi:hypothetical protein